VTGSEPSTAQSAPSAAAAPRRRKTAAKKKRVTRTPRSKPAQAVAARAPRESSQSTAVVFEALAAVLSPYLHLFEAEMHPRMGYCLKTWGEWPSEVYFAGVQWSEEGLHFHLFPLQRFPDLLDGASEELRARMQGKISFRFTTFEPERFAELASMTARAYERLRADGLSAQAA
jgi:hypothetical protein